MRWVALSLAVVACSGSKDENVVVADAALPTIPVGHPPSRTKPPNTVGGFKLEIPKITLQPGEEKIVCWVGPLKVEGPSRMVGGGVLRVGKGLHHGNVTTRPRRPDSVDYVRVCPPEKTAAIGGEGSDVLDGGTVLFGSSTQVAGEEWQSFPEGMAFRVKEGFEIAARVHYLNASSAPLEIQPSYEWFTVDAAKVKTELGAFLWTYPNFEIPARTRTTVQASCTLPSPMKIVTLMPHMHKLGVSFTAGFLGGPLDGKNFLESKGYDPDRGLIMQWDPAVDTAHAEGVTFSCTWENTFDKTITEGIGDNEMCMAFGYGYPVGKVYTLMGTSGALCPALAPAP
jgi:hypothetical protein